VCTLQQMKGYGVTQRNARTDLHIQLQQLKTKLDFLKDRLTRVPDRMDGLNRLVRGKQLATADTAKCSGCRICERVCPVGAIRVSEVARVDKHLCTGCGICVRKCPRGALTLNRR